jgi:hypothetical protein
MLKGGYNHLITDMTSMLTIEEINQGYCFCNDWGGMLLRAFNANGIPNPEAFDCCSYNCKAKRLFKTI